MPATTGLGLPLLLIRRSAAAVTVVVTPARLSVLSGSAVALETTASLNSEVPGATSGATNPFTVTVAWFTGPGSRSPRPQVSVR